MKKVICIILCICFVFGFAFNAPNANALSAALVIGGTVVISLATAATISLIAANATGMSQNIIDKAAADNISANTLMQNLIQDYANARFKRITDILSVINAGTSIVSSGEVTFNGSLSDFYTDFLEWAHSEDGGNLIEYDQTVPGTEGSVNVNGIENPTYDLSNITFLSVSYGSASITYSNGKVWTYSSNRSNTVFCTDGNYIYLVDFEQFQASARSSAGGGFSGSSYKSTFDNGVDYYTTSFSISVNGDITSSSIDFSQFSGTFSPKVAYACLYGNVEPSSVPVNTGIYDLPSNKDTNVLDVPKVISVPDYGSIQDIQGKTDVQQWLDAASDVIYQGSGTISIEDDGGIVTEYPVGLADVGDITVTQTTTSAIEESIEGTGTTYKPVGSGTATDEVTQDFSIDLRDFFPFCIPFDIYAMLSLFSGTPQAPNVEWRFYVPGIIDQTIELDLSIFDPVAAVLRNVELIAFGIFLAFNSKKILFGS